MSQIEDPVERARPLFRQLEELERQAAKIREAIRRTIAEDAAGSSLGKKAGRHPRQIPALVSPEKPAGSPALLEVADALRKLGKPGAADDIAKALGVTLDTARIRILRAEKKGVIVRVSRGKYVDRESAPK